MRRIAWIVLGLQAALVAGVVVALRSGGIPLGVPGEWEWQRVKIPPSPPHVVVGLVAVALYSLFVARGYQAIRARPSRRSLAKWLLGLALASVVVQGLVQEAAPEGYGLSKWIVALRSPGSSGYYSVAKIEMTDSRRFLSDYPRWIARQDALHIGTHPPGLFVQADLLLKTMQTYPGVSRLVCDLAPGSASSAVLLFRSTMSLPRADLASLLITGALTLSACALTVIPLYHLARSCLPEAESWAVAAFWPLVPSALMFQPTADTAFPLLSTTALALACWATRVGSKRGWILAVTSGLVMALGMFCTLAFLPVGLVVALILLSDREIRISKRVALILATGVGFLAGTFAWWAATSANPWRIWWINQSNHARFYREFPKSYTAWVFENPLELMIALGLPAILWAGIGLAAAPRSQRVTWSTLLVLTLLTITGKNLSEVARLWLPLMPPILVATGAGLARFGGGPGVLGGSVALVGLQAILLEATIQVVYPIQA